MQTAGESMFKKPEIYVFAGANGSGKTTVVQNLLKTLKCPYYNADDIKATSQLDDLGAAKLAESLREVSLLNNGSFAFETVLSTDRNLNLLRRAKEKGYFIRVFYVITKDPSINVARVAKRVLKGGHDVPKDKIISRYYKTLSLMPDVIDVSDICYIYDNSAQDKMVRIFKKRKTEFFYHETDYWTVEKIKELTHKSNLVRRDFKN